jgi:hypothetical protein
LQLSRRMRFNLKNVGRAYALLVVAIFLLSIGDYGWSWYKQNHPDWAHPSPPESCGYEPALGTTPHASIQITGGSYGKFEQVGQIFIPATNWPKLSSKIESVFLDEMDSLNGQSALPGVPFKLGAPHRWRVPGQFDAYRMVLEPTSVQSIPKSRIFPIDRYDVGMAALCVEIQTVDGAAYRIPVSFDLNFSGDSGWESRLAVGSPYSSSLFDREQVVQTPRDALQQKCELIISRSYWHIGLIFTLALILSTPALYVLRKPSESAGLELIAAVIGLGAIRCYLLGTPSSIGDLQLTDFYFAIVVGWVALIPLFRYDKGHDT